MGQILHASATTTHAVRAAIQRSKAPLKELAAQYGLNHKTVAKWRKRAFVNDVPMGPKAPRSTVLSPEEEAIVVAFRKHTLLPLDDCLYALQATIPNLTRSSLHRCLKRHGISRLPEIAGDKISKKPFKRYPIGYFHIDIAEVRTGEGKLYLFVAILMFFTTLSSLILENLYFDRGQQGVWTAPRFDWTGSVPMITTMHSDQNASPPRVEVITSV